MTDIGPGSLVECIDDSEWAHKIQKGRIYTVHEVRALCYRGVTLGTFVDVGDPPGGWGIRRFRPIPKDRIDAIRRIAEPARSGGRTPVTEAV